MRDVETLATLGNFALVSHQVRRSWIRKDAGYRTQHSVLEDGEYVLDVPNADFMDFASIVSHLQRDRHRDRLTALDALYGVDQEELAEDELKAIRDAIRRLEDDQPTVLRKCHGARK